MFPVFSKLTVSRAARLLASGSVVVLIAALADRDAVAQSGGQSSVQSLPSIVIQGQSPKARKRAPRPAPVTARVQPAPVAPPAPATRAGETGTGPVPGFVARQSVTATKTDTP